MHSGEPGRRLGREEELFGHCAMDFLLAVWWERSQRAQKSFFCLEKAATARPSKETWVLVQFFSHSLSSYKVG